MTAPADLVAFCQAQYPRLVALLRLHAGDPDAAQDLAQEALTRVCERWERVRAMEHPDRWTIRVAINLSTSRHRRRTTERRAEARRPPPSPVAGPEDVLLDRDVLRIVMGRLGERQRAVVIMRFLLDLSVSEVAAILGMSDGGVRSATSRALDMLRHDAQREIVERTNHA